MQIIRKVGKEPVVAYIGDEEPLNPMKGMLWIDSSDQEFVLKVYDGERWVVVRTGVTLDLMLVDGGSL
jgi:hypothetical protein